MKWLRTSIAMQRHGVKIFASPQPSASSRLSVVVSIAVSSWYLVLLICYYFSKPSRPRAGRVTPGQIDLQYRGQLNMSK